MTTHKEDMVVGAHLMPGNPYAIPCTGTSKILSSIKPRMVFVDRVIGGIDIDCVQIWKAADFLLRHPCDALTDVSNIGLVGLSQFLEN